MRRTVPALVAFLLALAAPAPFRAQSPGPSSTRLEGDWVRIDPDGVGSSPVFIRIFRRRSGSLSGQLMPESRTAIVTSGRPVVVFHAPTTHGPITPNSSCGFVSSNGLPL